MGVISSNIKTARKNAGLNQSQLAQKAGITKAAVSRYESGLREPRSEHLKAIAEALGITTDELLGIAPLPPQNIPLYEGSQEKVSLSSEDQEFEAFTTYLEGMGYRTVLELNFNNPDFLWTMYDNRSGKKYYLTAGMLDKLMHSINSFTKFQVNAILTDLEETAPDATNIQD